MSRFEGLGFPDMGVGIQRTTTALIVLLLSVDDSSPEEILASVCGCLDVDINAVQGHMHEQLCSECTMGTMTHDESCSMRPRRASNRLQAALRALQGGG